MQMSRSIGEIYDNVIKEKKKQNGTSLGLSTTKSDLSVGEIFDMMVDRGIIKQPEPVTPARAVAPVQKANVQNTFNLLNNKAGVKNPFEVAAQSNAQQAIIQGRAANRAKAYSFISNELKGNESPGLQDIARVKKSIDAAIPGATANDKKVYEEAEKLLANWLNENSQSKRELVNNTPLETLQKAVDGKNPISNDPFGDESWLHDDNLIAQYLNPAKGSEKYNTEGIDYGTAGMGEYEFFTKYRDGAIPASEENQKRYNEIKDRLIGYINNRPEKGTDNVLYTDEYGYKINAGDAMRIKANQNVKSDISASPETAGKTLSELFTGTRKPSSTPVSSAELKSAGWEASGDSIINYAKSYSSPEYNNAAVFSPVVLDDKGAVQRILTPSELEKYASDVLSGKRGDNLGLQMTETYEGNYAASLADVNAQRIRRLSEKQYAGTEVNGVEYGNDNKSANDLGVDPKEYVHYLIGQQDKKTNDYITKQYSDMATGAIEGIDVPEWAKPAQKALSGIAATAANIATSPLQALEYIENIASNLSGSIQAGNNMLSAYRLPNVANDYVTNLSNASTSAITEEIRNGIRGDGDNDFLNGLADAAANTYGGISSGAQSVLIGLTCEALFPGVGSAVAAGTMSMQAAENTYNEQIRNGATVGRATMYSALSGLNEYIGEKVSLENLFSIVKAEGKQTAKQFLVQTLKQSGVEASEEVTTSLLNELADRIVNGDQATYFQNVQRYLEAGYSQEEAEKKASEDFFIGLALDAYGGAVGGLIGGGVGSATNFVNRRAAANAAGQAVYNEGTMDELYKLAESMAENEAVKKQRETYDTVVEKYGRDSKKAIKQAGKLYAAIQDENLTSVDNALSDERQKTLEKLYAEQINADVADATVAPVAEILNKHISGENLSAREQRILNNEAAQNTLRAYRTESENVYAKAKENQNKAMERYNEAADLANPKQTISKQKYEANIDDFNTHTDDNNVYTADGTEQVDIKDIAAVGKNDVQVELSNGKTESIKSLDLPEGKAAAYQAALDTQNAIGAEISPELFGDIVSEIESADDGVDLSDHAINIRKAIQNGYVNNSVAYNADTNTLSESAYKAFYEQGRKLAAAHTKAQQAAVQRKAASNQKRGAGSVTFTDGLIQDKRTGAVSYSENGKTYRGIGKAKQTGVDLVSRLAKALGFDVVFYRSTQSGKKAPYSSQYVSKNGFAPANQAAPNGFWRNGTMYLDINSGMNGEGLILYTASHELVHMIREGSPASFDALADFMVENYVKAGVNIDDLMQHEMDSNNLSYDEAYEEVIARACEDFLRDTHINDKAKALYKQDRTLWEKIRDALKKILDNLKELMEKGGLYEKGSSSAAARLTARMGYDIVEQAHDLWIKGILDSAENLRNMEKATDNVKRQSRTDSDYLSAVERGDMETAQRMVDEAAKAAGYTVKAYHQTARDFTVFNTDNPKAGLNDSETPNGIFFKTNDHDIGLEGKKQMAGYLNVGNVLDFNDRAEANKWYRKNVEGYEALDVAMKDEVKRIEEKMNAIERDMFRDGITDEEYETFDSEWNELLEEMRGIENEYRGKLRELLNDYFLIDSSGYDSIHLRYDGHRYVEGKREDVETYIVFKNTQIKSADPVTYDDNGDVIPLSERFNESNKDIRYQSRFDDFDIDLFEDDSVENIFAREYATHHEDIGEVLRNISDIELSPEKVSSIVNRILRNNLGVLDAETRRTLSTELQLALENVDRTDPETVSNEMIAAVRKAIDNAEITDEHNAENYKELRDYFKGGKYYLTDEQIADLKEHDMTLNDFKKAMMGKITIVKRENVNHTAVNPAHKLSLEGMYDELTYPEEYLPFSREQWDEYGYHAPIILMETFDKLKNRMTGTMSEMMSAEDIDYLAVNLTAKLTGAIVEEKYKEKYHGNDSAQIRKALKEQQKQTDDYIALLVENLAIQHETQLAEIKEASKNKIAEIKQKERERAKKREQEIREKVREQRRKNANQRQRTQLRNSARKKMRKLDKLLNRSDKNKTVKQGLRPTVSKLLEVADLLFPATRTLEQMAREGVPDATPAEQKLLDRYVEYLDIREKTTTEQGRKNANAMLSQIRKALTDEKGVTVEVEDQGKTVKKKMSLTARERLRYDNAMRAQNSTRLKDALQEVADAYSAVKDSEIGYIRDSFDQTILDSIADLRKDVGDTLAKDMTFEQLETLNTILTRTIKSIQNANKSFMSNKSVSDRATAAMREVSNIRKLKDDRNRIMRAMGEFAFWNNLKPIYAMRYIGSDTLTEAYWNVQNGENIWFQDIEAAREFKHDLDVKYGVGKLNTKNKKDFNFNKKATFTALDGSKFTLSLNQMMDIYAASRRPQALQHLLRGGFTFAKDARGDHWYSQKVGAKVYQLTAETIDRIISQLTTNEKMYVEEMQKYLSSTMADKGNEVSMELHGVKLFNEEIYWSISSTDIYAPQSEKEQENKGNLVKKIRNAGFTNATVKNASNPIVLQGFEENWSNHVNEMSLYHAMTLPLEDLTKIINYRERGNDNAATTGVRGVVNQAYGNAASKYLSTLIDDINGGLMERTRTGGDKLISLAKKGAVLANLSVILQQPSAVFRAMAYVNIRYFLLASGNKFYSFSDKKFSYQKHNEMYEELCKYAPVAGIKRMGSFDTGNGRGVMDYLSSGGQKGLGQKAYEKIADDIPSKLPQLADEIAWVKLWQAIQHETKAKYGYALGTEENKVKSGERFNEVVHLTQVYDSVMSRSQAMRSKATYDKILTSFMAEPTTIMNMVIDAAVQSKRQGFIKGGGWKTAGRGIVKGVGLSILANALLHAIAIAMRDKDEEETFADKHSQALWNDLKSALNPFSYFPILRDISSLAAGYNVDRLDMSLVSELFKTVQKAAKKFDNGTATADTVIDTITAVASLFGLPAKNLVRDIRSVINTVKIVNKPEYNLADDVGINAPLAYQKGYDNAWSNGYSEDDCVKKGEAKAREYIKKVCCEIYLNALRNQDMGTVSQIIQIMVQSGYYHSTKKGGTVESAVDETLKKWRSGKDQADERAAAAAERQK